MYETLGYTPVEIFTFYLVVFLSLILTYPIFKLILRAIGVVK